MDDRAAAGPFPPALRRSIGVIMIGSALSFLHAPLAQVQWVVTGPRPAARPRRTTRPHHAASHVTDNHGGPR